MEQSNFTSNVHLVAGERVSFDLDDRVFHVPKNADLMECYRGFVAHGHALAEEAQADHWGYSGNHFIDWVVESCALEEVEESVRGDDRVRFDRAFHFVCLTSFDEKFDDETHWHEPYEVYLPLPYIPYEPRHWPLCPKCENGRGKPNEDIDLETHDEDVIVRYHVCTRCGCEYGREEIILYDEEESGDDDIQKRRTNERHGSWKESRLVQAGEAAMILTFLFAAGMLIDYMDPIDRTRYHFNLYSDECNDAFDVHLSITKGEEDRRVIANAQNEYLKTGCSLYRIVRYWDDVKPENTRNLP